MDRLTLTQRGRLFPFSAASIKFTTSKNYFKNKQEIFKRACTLRTETIDASGILPLCSPRAQHATILLPELAPLALSRKSTLQVPVATP
jgi:hypothetical protein